ncbi:peptidoglycan DD-metalloendopeptidase family protein [soil metagenome]
MKARLALAVALCALAAGPALAQADVPPPPPVPATRDARQAELDAVTRDITLSETRKADLKRDIDALDKDRTTLNQSLIDANLEVQKLEAASDRTERRWRALLATEDKLRASLNERRDILAEILAALQRMGRRPPPAILVRPEDALTSVRSAILLGAIVPDLRDAANKVADDLRALVALRQEQERERDRLRADSTALIEGRARVTLLLEQKRAQRTASAEALANEDKRAKALADQATSLRDLIARLESENATAGAAAAAADKAAAIARTQGGGKPAKSLGKADRLAPAVAFVDAKGLLPMPVSGRLVRGFGEKDGLGGRSQGISVATRASGQVSSPTDGWIVYSGPFRSYGQLLIINAGDGYHVLLAGMERADVQLGQFVLAGEPVAVMASQKLASVGAVDVGATQPVLYIEFRKDGTSIDPAPWWAASNMEKVGG